MSRQVNDEEVTAFVSHVIQVSQKKLAEEMLNKGGCNSLQSGICLFSKDGKSFVITESQPDEDIDPEEMLRTCIFPHHSMADQCYDIVWL